MMPTTVVRVCLNSWLSLFYMMMRVKKDASHQRKQVLQCNPYNDYHNLGNFNGRIFLYVGLPSENKLL